MKRIPSITDFVPVITVNALKLRLKERFRIRRKEQKISQLMLAQRSGVSYASIRRFESTGEISLHSLLSICQAIGLLEELDGLFKQPIIKNLKDFK
jgi:transcriptional regulator with XRE-family HTH domain